MRDVLMIDHGQPEPKSEPALLCATGVAELLGVSERTIWRLRAAGKLPPAIRLGGNVRWRATDVAAWIEAGCPQPTAPAK